MRRIAVINQKGGVGKTTTTVNLASLFPNATGCPGAADDTALADEVLGEMAGVELEAAVA